MNAPQISNILDRPASSIERPKPLPQGNYVWVVKGMPRHDKSAQKKTPYVEYKVSPLSAGDDVDQEALTEWATKPDGSTRVLQEHEAKLTFYLTEGSAFMLKDFIGHCGIEEEGFENLRQGSEMVPGCQFGGTITHRVSDNGGVFAELKTTYKLDDVQE